MNQKKTEWLETNILSNLRLCFTLRIWHYLDKPTRQLQRQANTSNFKSILNSNIFISWPGNTTRTARHNSDTYDVSTSTKIYPKTTENTYVLACTIIYVAIFFLKQAFWSQKLLRNRLQTNYQITWKKSFQKQAPTTY